MTQKKSKAASAGRGITLNSLRERQCALNRQMLLAIQLHDGRTQERLRRQLEEVQEEIDRISLRL